MRRKECWGCEEEKDRPNVTLSDEEIALARKRLGREPNATEWAMIDVMWSEHCSYKSSRRYLKLFPTEGKDVWLPVGDDCGIVGFDDKWGIAVGMESHNHPSAIEPVAGAATGIGGIVRDVFSKGAKPIACLDPLRLGDIKNHERSKYLFENIVKGIADYGNCIGVPTIGGEAEFDESFNGNPLVNVVCVGLVEKDKIVRSIANEGDTMMLIGSKTGRDGIHGVTFASEELTTESEEESRPAVQIEDPLSEKLLIDAFMEIYKTDAFTGCKDLGGGGFTCATSEIVHKGGKGALIDLDRVHLREEGMEPWEILLSETQERMLLIVKSGRESEVERILDKWDVPHARVGVVTNDGRYRVKYRGKTIVDMPTHILTEGPLFDRGFEPVPKAKIKKPEISDIKGYLLKLLQDPNIASKRWIYEQYDHEVQVRTVVKPGQDASVIRITDKAGVALGVGCNSAHCAIDPIEGAKEAVAEALRNITAVGAKPLAAVDCLNFGNPEKPKAFWQFKVSVENLAEGFRALGIPVISGNVSFYNETSGKSINPSPIVTIVGKVDLDKVMTMSLKKEGDEIVLIGKTHAELGDAPKVDFQVEKKTNKLIFDLIDGLKVSAVHDLSKGGLAVGLALMAFKGNRGFDVNIARMDESISDAEKLFSESNGRYVVTTEYPEYVLRAAEKAGVKAQIIGRVIGEDLSYGPFSVSLHKAKRDWETALEKLLI
ncbi:MAG: phosphoribosylformylglycinamidine synthase subunit PurL [candidate division WOR-3 bacterium]